ncbi:MAG: phosphoribosylglycinamide formyltransferase [Actinomycetia bacterium]|nr:phosphoribosylglycinamide formyltransferase [Actinomycetes bacterium]
MIDARAAGHLNAEIALVVSSRPDAQGLQRAGQAGIPTIALSRAVYKEAWAADELICEALTQAGCDYVVLAGYMRQVHPELLDAFCERVINLHPALLPAFPGAHAIEDAWQRGVKVTGVTVHFVNDEYDAGPIIAQRAVEVRPEDSLESLTERIHAVEHQLLPETLQLVAAGRVAIGDDGKVTVK